MFKLIQQDKIWLGKTIHSGDREFSVPDDSDLTSPNSRIDEDGNKFKKVPGIRWFTNLEYPDRFGNLELTELYSESKYPKYDNYDAINVDKTMEIPLDYKGEMGVPITFMDKYNPDQFEIIGLDFIILKEHTGKHTKFKLDGNQLFSRILIKKKTRAVS